VIKLLVLLVQLHVQLIFKINVHLMEQTVLQFKIVQVTLVLLSLNVNKLLGAVVFHVKKQALF